LEFKRNANIAIFLECFLHLGTLEEAYPPHEKHFQCFPLTSHYYSCNPSPYFLSCPCSNAHSTSRKFERRFSCRFSSTGTV